MQPSSAIIGTVGCTSFLLLALQRCELLEACHASFKASAALSMPFIADIACIVQKILSFELWRWFLFLAGITPICYVSSWAIHWTINVLERYFLATRKVLYFVVGMKVSMHAFRQLPKIEVVMAR